MSQLDSSPTFQTLREFAKRFPEIDVSVLETCVYLIFVGRLIGDAMDIHFARHDLSKGRFQILANLKRKEGPLSPAELSECCGVTRATVTGLVDTLEHAGLVERLQDSQDRRSVQVRLTPAGEKKVDDMLPDHYRRITGLMAGLTKDERDVLKKLLEKIENGLPAIREP